jgi:transcriptional regulator with XRE-family HTH domain
MDDHTRTRLRQAREALGWTLDELAQASGNHYMTVWRHENGQPLSQASLRKYAEALRCQESWLAEGRGCGPGGKGLDIVEEYLATDLGQSADKEVRRLLREISYPSLGVRKPSLQTIHRVRDLIESNRALERQHTDGKRGKQTDRS